ncbi:alpha-N-acetylglucosaminidase [Streptomyces sp. NBC_00576]|uniref:alpha-N-acetylglucosaminidase n=1 Tax=Streptomyces sp. NBC_00576 TaxID=2903665 RepID=UPI002E800306|nr:alpha-N-acetylglucosaminidase [Streptomyces sp. NBC_00576]WUB76768.1 alpha-N-acetylglucosaminidase [Streptomyces sp. NBC_00576]
MHDNQGDLGIIGITGVTRRRVLTGTVALGGASLLARPQGAYAADGAPFDTGHAAAALKRLLPGHHRQVTLRAVGGDTDRFRVTGRAGHITVEGTSPAVLLAGLHTYLRRTAHASVSWTGEQLNLPRTLPAPTEEIAGTANVPHRFAFNDTNEGYTGAYRDWDAWQRELDVLAVHGVNRVLVYIGGDAVYYDMFRRFGYSDSEMRAWIPAPAHQPWWLLQNMSGFGGPVSRQLIERRAVLAEKIVDRIRDLGMTPVLPGYYGSVPDDFPARHGGDAAVVAQGSWGAFKRPDWLDPRTTAFDDVAAAFYRAQTERFGDSTMYKMDLLHEGGNPGDVPVGEAARAVEAALQNAHPGALWAILGWQTNPSKALLDGVDKSRMLIVDGLSDRYTTVTDRESDWGGTPYAFGSIWNFGGHTPMGANAPDWVEQYPKWRDKEGSSLAGIAAMPEAADNNAPALALLTDLAWTPGVIDLDDWFAAYALSRYGGPDRHAAAAWQTIRDTAYNMSRADSWSEAPDGLFGARPSLGANKAAAWGPEADRYDTTAFDTALTELLAVRAELRDSSAYRYDVVDVARQVLSNRSRVLLPQIRAAHQAGDKALFGKLARTWLEWMDLLDDLLAASGPHLLGRWLADARSWGADRTEKDRLEYDARSLITTWGGLASSEEGLHDYANREWAGLVGGLYRTRWKTYFDALAKGLATGKDPATIDWFALEDRWAHAHETHPTEPHGSPYALARRVRDLLAATPHQGTLTAGTDRGAVAEGTPATVTVTFTNRNGFAAARGVTLSVTVPEGLAVTPLDPVRTASVASGETITARFEVSLTGEPTQLVGRVVAAAVYAGGGKAVAPVRLVAAAGVGDPYRTVSFNDAVFGQAGDEFAVEGAGADLWGATNEFGAVYRAGAYGDAAVAEVTVTSQDATGGWARAGLVVRNDLGTQGSAGYVNLAVTPSNGCALSWDADGDGRFDSIALSGSFTAPVRLRLMRSDASYTGQVSTDGVTWTTVGTATPGGAATAQDVGVFMTAANGWTGTRGIATFDGFTVA